MMRLATSFRGASPRRALHPRIQATVDGLEQNHPAVMRAEDTGLPLSDVLVDRARRIETRWLEARARVLVTQAIEDEERRLADRRRLGRAGGRREDDRQPASEPDWDEVAERRAGL